MAVRKYYYTYWLIDPRDLKPFYVGKGTGNRMYQHGARSDRVNVEKTKRIEDIGRDKVIREQIACFLYEPDAYRHEADLIKSTPNLTNKRHGESDKPKQLIKMFVDLCRSVGSDKELMKAVEIMTAFPFRVINMPFAETYNSILDTTESLAKSKGLEIKYG